MAPFFIPLFAPCLMFALEGIYGYGSPPKAARILESDRDSPSSREPGEDGSSDGKCGMGGRAHRRLEFGPALDNPRVASQKHAVVPSEPNHLKSYAWSGARLGGQWIALEMAAKGLREWRAGREREVTKGHAMPPRIMSSVHQSMSLGDTTRSLPEKG